MRSAGLSGATQGQVQVPCLGSFSSVGLHRPALSCMKGALNVLRWTEVSVAYRQKGKGQVDQKIAPCPGMCG